MSSAKSSGIAFLHRRSTRDLRSCRTNDFCCELGKQLFERLSWKSLMRNIVCSKIFSFFNFVTFKPGNFLDIITRRNCRDCSKVWEFTQKLRDIYLL